MHMQRLVCLVVCLGGLRATVRAQDNRAGSGDQGKGLPISESVRLRVNVKFMAGYSVDESHYDIGLESQGRLGYATIDVSGKISDRFMYRFEINPMNETQPLPACPAEHFFYPNTPQAFGPGVVCEPDGLTRVDDYRSIALDVLNQQGPIRQAYFTYMNASGSMAGTFGRFLLPIGFNWEDAGSYTVKDSTHIQRINAETNFGIMLTFKQPIVTVDVAGVIGDGNRFHDYDYYYSLDRSLDTNSSMTGVASASFHLHPALDLLVAQKTGFTGSKVESLPNFYASKRIDRATVGSVRYRPTAHTSVFGEIAAYRWGVTQTSAEMLGFADTSPVKKNGYYVGADGSIKVTTSARLGATITREEIDRDDALIKYLAMEHLMNVTVGEKERSTVMRFYADLGRHVRVATFVTLLDNPFPWVSGIWKSDGPDAFTGPRGNNKWGIVGRFALD